MDEGLGGRRPGRRFPSRPAGAAVYAGVAPGYTIYTGFEAIVTGPLTLPSGFALNGTPCTVSTNS